MADYYSTLGVDKSADDAALKKAFRKQAMQYHPDRNPGDAKAEHKFKELNEAYAILSDPQKRAAYDRMGHAAFTQSGGQNAGRGGGHPGGSHGFHTGGFEDIFEDFFGDIFGGGTPSGRGRQPNGRGTDLRYNLDITLEEAYHGKTVQVNIPTFGVCNTCDGSGAKPGTKPITCGTCGGVGEVRVSQGFFSMRRTCPACNGSGQTIAEKCTTCSGAGRTRETRKLSVKIPKGVDDGTRIRLSGEGEAGAQGGPAGDLYIFISTQKHPLFARNQRDLHLEIPLPALDAMLGGSVDVPTPDGGRASIKIPEGTQPSQTFRLRGKGMPVLNQGGYGDLLVTVNIEIPTKLTKTQKENLESLRQEMAGKHAPLYEKFVKSLEKFWRSEG